MSQDPGLSPHQQPPLTLIQMREDRLELRRQTGAKGTRTPDPLIAKIVDTSL